MQKNELSNQLISCKRSFGGELFVARRVWGDNDNRQTEYKTITQ